MKAILVSGVHKVLFHNELLSNSPVARMLPLLSFGFLNDERSSVAMNKKMIRVIYGLLAAILILGCFPDASGAQGNRDDAEAARYALEKTDAVIETASKIVKESRSGKARKALEQAVRLQGRARSNQSLSNFAIALALTGEARKEAWHAVALAREHTRKEERLERLFEETRERILRVRSRMAESGIRDQRIMRLLDESRSLLDKSRVNQQQLRGELALRLAENAGKLAVQAEQRLRRVRNLKEMCEHRLELMERLMNRARSRVRAEAEPAAGEKLEMALRNMNRAREAFRSGNYEACRINLENGEAVLRSLVRNISPGGPYGAEAMLEETRELYERAREMVRENGASAAGPGLEQAGRILGEAEEALARGRTEAAVRMIERARRLLRRSVTDASRENIREELGRLEQARESARESLKNCPAEGARRLFERALVRHENASRLAGEGQADGAAAQARIARNLYQRIREICAY